MASRGISVVYSLSDAAARKQLLDGLVSTLQGGSRCVRKRRLHVQQVVGAVGNATLRRSVVSVSASFSDAQPPSCLARGRGSPCWSHSPQLQADWSNIQNPLYVGFLFYFIAILLNSTRGSRILVLEARSKSPGLNADYAFRSASRGRSSWRAAAARFAQICVFCAGGCKRALDHQAELQT